MRKTLETNRMDPAGIEEFKELLTRKSRDFSRLLGYRQ